MARGTRNHSVTGVALLVSAALIGFASTQAWVATALHAPAGLLGELGPNYAFGFDKFPSEGSRGSDIRPILVVGSVGLAVFALLLFVTRVPGLGVLWRLLASLCVAASGFTAAIAWTTVKSPVSVVTDPESFFGSSFGTGINFAQNLGFLDIQPAMGLWLLTVGTGIAGIGLLIPAIRGQKWDTATPTAQPTFPPPTSVPAAGWYPDQVDGRFLRYFDGVRWTDAIRPRD
jgi:hypothetical protein